MHSLLEAVQDEVLTALSATESPFPQCARRSRSQPYFHRVHDLMERAALALPYIRRLHDQTRPSHTFRQPAQHLLRPWRA